MKESKDANFFPVARLRWRIVVYESLGFILLMAWCWFDEFFDLPALLFGAEPSGTNVVEAIEESIVIFLFGVIVVFTSFRLLRNISILEGIAPTCAFCKKIRANGKWIVMEEYFTTRTELEFSHSFCPTCMEREYGIREEVTETP